MNRQTPETELFRGEIFYFHSSPLERANSFYHYPDGGLLVSGGKIAETAPFEILREKYPEVPVTDYSGRLLMPGLIDSHIHFSQTEIIGMYGKQLLDWLNDYTFPAEEAFSSDEHASAIAGAFIGELLKNGTTACMAYATTCPGSATALFQAASDTGMCMIAGKVMMDRNAPEALSDTVEQGEEECRNLIERWHGKGRNRYAVTPRFALTSSPGQLRSAGRLLADYPGVYLQTHLSENREEIRTALSLYPEASDYLEIYERAGLLTDRSVFGHCIHLSGSERGRIASAGAAIAHCPTSNLFLGSGLFDLKHTDACGIRTVLATDVGAGTSFSLLRTMGEAYKVQQLNGYSLNAPEAFYRCTLGAARALHLEEHIGSFRSGTEADFIVIDETATAQQKLRREYLLRNRKWNIENRLFGLEISGDDRNIAATYLRGKKVYENRFCSVNSGEGYFIASDSSRSSSI